MLEALFILLLIAAGQGIFLSATLCTNRDKGLSNLFLGLIVLFFSLQLFDLVLLSSGKALVYPHLTFWSIPFNLAFGPLLYLYILSMTSGGTPLRKSQLLHFIPFVLHLGYISMVYHFQGAAYKVELIQEFLIVQSGLTDQSPSVSELFSAIIMYLQFGIYIVMSRRLISDEDELRNWLQKLWIAILIIGLFGFVQFLLLVTGIDQQPVTGYLAAIIAVLYIYSGAILLLRRPKVIFGSQEAPKYQYSSIRSEERSALLERLRSYMQDHAPYKQPDLTLKQLAKLMEVSERHISQTINEQLEQNFSDFLNEYRVNEFKAQLNQPANQHLSLLGIAMDCGFNSKSTFNTVFKRFTGQTPSEFKRQQQKNN